jgi:hypothetical protein
MMMMMMIILKVEGTYEGEIFKITFFWKEGYMKTPQ